MVIHKERDAVAVRGRERARESKRESKRERERPNERGKTVTHKKEKWTSDSEGNDLKAECTAT